MVTKLIGSIAEAAASFLTERQKKNREYAIGSAREKVLAWYLQVAQCRPLAAVNEKQRDGAVWWFLEPYIQNEVNPMVVTRTEGDHFVVSIDERPLRIISYGGLGK